MPIIKSAKKSLRQSKKRALNNLKKKREMKDLLKKIQTLISEDKIEEAKKVIPQLQKTLDKAVKTNLIKKNTASRKKSRVVKALNKVKSK
jgi:small subunit ribosomal protein S20